VRRGGSSPKRLWTGLALCLAVEPTPARALQPPPRFPTAAELVTVDVVVLDRDGKPVPGLTRADFVVREDGRPQNVTAFETIAALLPAVGAGDGGGDTVRRARGDQRAGPPTRAPSRSCSTTFTSAQHRAGQARSGLPSTRALGRATG
jgi:hypothetical protein